MPDLEKDWQKLIDISKADRAEWARIIENPKLRLEVFTIQRKYGLPLNYEEFVRKWYDFHEKIEINPESGEITAGFHWKRHFNLLNDLEKLSKEFNVSKRWHSTLFRWVTIGNEAPDSQRMGFPSLSYKDQKFTVNIDSITPIDNPYIQEFIKIVQARNDPPPKPVRDRENSRKLDWRPVWEWSKRHPWIHRRELAKLLSYNYVYIKRKLEEIDKENK